MLVEAAPQRSYDNVGNRRYEAVTCRGAAFLLVIAGDVGVGSKIGLDVVQTVSD